MAGYSEQISDQEKIRIVGNFIKSAPAGEFNEVFNDVRSLLNNDPLLQEGAASAFSEYSVDQLTPAKVGSDTVLVTRHGMQDNSKFLDPRGRRTFVYDHLRKKAGETAPARIDESAEPWRAALEKALQSHIKDHYPDGVVTVYGSTSGGGIKLVACIEDHKFSPKNYWNGRWRAEWIATFSPGGSGELKGVLKVQVHYFEDGNVQLVSNKDVKESFRSSSEDGTAKELVKLIEAAENDYQSALSENYKTMSQTTFKALRRALPVTRTKVDWNKIAAYNIGVELKGK